MRCHDIAPLLATWHELTPAEQVAPARHLATCSACAALAQQEGALTTLLLGIPYPPGELSQQRAASLTRSFQQPRLLHPRAAATWLMGTLAVLVLVVLTQGMLLPRYRASSPVLSAGGDRTMLPTAGTPPRPSAELDATISVFAQVAVGPAGSGPAAPVRTGASVAIRPPADGSRPPCLDAAGPWIMYGRVERIEATGERASGTMPAPPGLALVEVALTDGDRARLALACPAGHVDLAPHP